MLLNENTNPARIVRRVKYGFAHNKLPSMLAWRTRLKPQCAWAMLTPTVSSSSKNANFHEETSFHNRPKPASTKLAVMLSDSELAYVDLPTEAELLEALKISPFL